MGLCTESKIVVRYAETDRMRVKKIPAKFFKALKASMDGTGKVGR